MSYFIKNLSFFLSECRNGILKEACSSKEYVDLKSKCLEITDKLQSSISSMHNALLIDFIDTLGVKGSIEISYCYLCGLRDGNESSDTQFNPIAKDTPIELSIYKRYVDSELKCKKRYNELQKHLDDKCRKLLDEYIETKNIKLCIEKSRCYAGGLLDKKRLDSQFNPSAVNEWNDLISTFL